MQIADSKSQFDRNPSVYDGFIEKRRKRSVDLTIKGKLYTVNRHGVLCSRTPLNDGTGRNWYGYTLMSEMFGGYLKEQEFIKSLSVGRDHIGRFYRPTEGA